MFRFLLTMSVLEAEKTAHKEEDAFEENQTELTRLLDSLSRGMWSKLTREEKRAWETARGLLLENGCVRRLTPTSVLDLQQPSYPKAG